MSVELGSRGTVKIETLTAIPVEEFIAKLKKGLCSELSGVGLGSGEVSLGEASIEPHPGKWANCCHPHKHLLFQRGARVFGENVAEEGLRLP
ncbi:MAG: hypothetical protein ACPLRM_06885, partial [Anaerolineae bacterium]